MSAFAAWFRRCDYCKRFRLRVYWWGYADTSCKRCWKRRGTWEEIKVALRQGQPGK